MKQILLPFPLLNVVILAGIKLAYNLCQRLIMTSGMEIVSVQPRRSISFEYHQTFRK
jgi:hypothetical protein